MEQPKKQYSNSDYVKFIAGSLRDIAQQLKLLTQHMLTQVKEQKFDDENELRF